MYAAVSHVGFCYRQASLRRFGNRQIVWKEVEGIAHKESVLEKEQWTVF